MSAQGSGDGGPEPPPLPPTDLLYLTYDGNWLSECKARVLRVARGGGGDDDDSLQVVLNRTILHAQGGGQPTDLGWLAPVLAGPDGGPALRVTKVTVDRDSGVATHVGTVAGGAPSGLRTGDAVRVAVDRDRRRILSECHTAGHVVDAAMARCGRFLKPSRAYHFLDGPYVEYEGTVPPEERGELLQNLQAAFCQLIEEDRPTTIELLSKNEADAICNRQAQNFDMDVFADKITGQVRVVTVAGYACPCGGTHVRSTLDLKANQWHISGIKCKNKVVRVKYGQGCGVVGDGNAT